MKIIPSDAIDKHIAVLGKTGAGKTFAAKSAIVEPLLEAHRHVCIVDPTDAWWGLRSSSDGKGPGFKILVLGGDHGDLPLTPNGGAAVARLVVEQGVNLIACTKHMMVNERTQWFTDFASTLGRLNRSPLHLVIDEAHNFAPQGRVMDPQSGKMLHAMNGLAAEGRSKGVRLTMLTQRPQKLHKDTLTSADTLVAMRVLAPQDRDAVRAWVDGCGDAKAGKEVLDSLASLQRGEGWVWYPEGGHLKRVTFPRIKTFDSSAAPTYGHAVAVPKGAAELDLSEINKALSDAVKKAEANDPKLLRKKVAELESEIRTLKFGLEDARRVIEEYQHTLEMERHAEATVKEVSVLTDADRQILRTITDETNRALLAATSQFEVVVREVTGYALEVKAILNKVDSAVDHRAAMAPQITHRPPAREPRSDGADRAARVAQSAPSGQGPGGGLRRMLIALAQRPNGLTNRQIGLRAGLSSQSGTFSTYLGRARAAGWIEDTGDIRRVTPAGLKALGQYEPLPTGRQLLNHWRNELGGGASRMLQALADAYPRGLTNEDLGRLAGISHQSGTFSTYLGRMRGLELVTGGRGDLLVASEELFE